MDVLVLLLPCAHLLVQINRRARQSHISDVHLLYNIIALILIEIPLHAHLWDVVHQGHRVAVQVMNTHAFLKMTQHIVGLVGGIIIVSRARVSISLHAKQTPGADVAQIFDRAQNNTTIVHNITETSQDVMSSQAMDVVMIVVPVTVTDEIMSLVVVVEIAPLSLRWIVRVVHTLLIARETCRTIYVKGHI